jgi:predicted nucleic acid-binding protein
VIVFDTGALIALERRRQRMLLVWSAAIRAKRDILVPGVVIAEWWRGRTDHREAILAGVSVVPVDAGLGRMAGEAVGGTPGATVVDAVVMSLAARHDAVVYTSDVEDLEAIRAFYPGVRVLST